MPPRTRYPVVSTVARSAKRRDLASTTSRPLVEARSLHAALRALVETTNFFRRLDRSAEREAERPCLHDQPPVRRSKVSPRGSAGLGRDDESNPVVSTGARSAERRDLASTSSRQIAEARSLHAALRALVETTNFFRRLDRSAERGAERPCLHNQPSVRRSKVSPRGPSGLGRDDESNAQPPVRRSKVSPRGPAGLGRDDGGSGRGYRTSRERSDHSGLAASIRATFFSRRHRLICFSRSIASGAVS